MTLGTDVTGPIDAAQRTVVEATQRAPVLSPRARERLVRVKGAALGWDRVAIASWGGRSEATVRRWLAAFRVGGMDALAGAPRADLAGFRHVRDRARCPPRRHRATGDSRPRQRLQPGTQSQRTRTAQPQAGPAESPGADAGGVRRHPPVLAGGVGRGALLWSLAHPRWEFVFQPSSAADLKLIEPWGKILRSLALRGHRFETWDGVEQAVERATAYYWNDHCHPFVWGGRKRRPSTRQPGIARVPVTA